MAWKKSVFSIVIVLVLILSTGFSALAAETPELPGASNDASPDPVASQSPDVDQEVIAEEPQKDKDPAAEEDPSSLKETTGPAPTLATPIFSGAVLAPKFSPDVFTYNLYIKDGAEICSVKALPNEEGTTVRYILCGKEITDTVVNGYFRFKPTDKGMTIALYKNGHIVLYRFYFRLATEAQTQLRTLALRNLDLDFDTATTTYRLNCVKGVGWTSVTPQTADRYSRAVIYYKNKQYAQGERIDLSVGYNLIKVFVGGLSGKVSAYSIYIYRYSGGTMTELERKFAETAMELLPERHPIRLAYQEAHGIKLPCYTKTTKGVRLSGVPFEFGGNAYHIGYSKRWWTQQSDTQYPAGGLDCSKYMGWIYKQLGYDVPTVSASLFFAGKEGVTRKLPGIQSHKVIPSVKEAKIGDIVYNSKDYSYRSGHGSHTLMFFGTARKLGIETVIQKYYKKFPVDKYLVIDVGWADGNYYYNMLRKIGINGRTSMCGVGVQFFSSIKESNGTYSYSSPYRSSVKSYSWKDSKTGQTFSIAANLERNSRPMQYKSTPQINVKYIANISRPIIRQD